MHSEETTELTDEQISKLRLTRQQWAMIMALAIVKLGAPPAPTEAERDEQISYDDAAALVGCSVRTIRDAMKAGTDLGATRVGKRIHVSKRKLLAWRESRRWVVRSRIPKDELDGIADELLAAE